MFATPRVALRKMMQGLKSVTARYANQILSRERIPFWQQEYYDHVCRNEAEFSKICGYIAMNPVKARLAQKPEDWKWSSVARRRALRGGAVAGVESVENATN